MMSPTIRSVLRTAAVLLAFAVAGTSLLTFVHFQTKDRIAHMQEVEKLKLINEILPRALYDNDIIKDIVKVPPEPLLGTSEDTVVYRARLKGKATAAVLEAVAPDGYGGKIRLIIAFNDAGAILGVRVVSHNETPGLGDYIEAAKDHWILQFNGLSRAAMPGPKDFRVKKDGGRIDYHAGATVTPRAVVKAIDKALTFYDDHKSDLLKEGGKS